MWKVVDFNWSNMAPVVIFSRFICGTKISFKSHYDVLGLTPKATQSDVKAAYYKLSMQYHPDKNKSDGAAKIFRDIAAAYEVLGNYKLRKLYDRGLLSTAGTEHTSTVHPDDKFYKSRETRHQTPVHEGKTPIYDFDEWTRSHYGYSFAKRTAARDKFEKRTRQRSNVAYDIQSERIIGFALLTILLLSYITFSSNTHDVDRLEKLNKYEVDNSQSRKS